MKSFRQYITEDPDTILLDDDTLHYASKDAVTFGYYDNKLYVLFQTPGKMEPASTHSDIKTLLLKNLKGNKRKQFIAQNKEKSFRQIMKHPGRLWKESKIISLWYDITKEELNKLVKDLVAKKIPIDDTWKIDIGMDMRKGISKLVPLNKYKSKEKFDTGKIHI